MNPSDFSLAKIRHQNWRLRLQSYLEDRLYISLAEAVSPRDCALGLWLYSKGLEQYGQWPEMKALEAEHAKMHAAVKEVMRLKESGDSEAARKEFEKIGPFSETIVALLTTLENRLAAKRK